MISILALTVNPGTNAKGSSNACRYGAYSRPHNQIRPASSNRSGIVATQASSVRPTSWSAIAIYHATTPMLRCLLPLKS